MNRKTHRTLGLFPVVLVLCTLAFPGTAWAKIDGVTGTFFPMTARAGYISLADGNALYCWGYSVGASLQYPGPTLIVNQGDTVTITLTNMLPASAGNVSIVFPGQSVTALGGVTGGLTQEAPPDGLTAVSYSFVAGNPGTYLYHSGTEPDLQVEMGLMGVLIVRPAGFDPLHPQAYNHAATAYDREYLFLLSEMDPRIHSTVEMLGKGALAGTDFLTDYFANYFFINGRVSPDIMAPAGPSFALPNQPYNCMPQAHPGEKILMRVVGGGHDLHPYHFHGNHARIIAMDGRLMESVPGVSGPDTGRLSYTIQSVPGETVDAIFVWDGKDLGWDIYGTDAAHMATTLVDNNGDGYDDTTHEWIADHGKPIPVVLPDITNTLNGPFYSGSPYLGAAGVLPPGEGGLNPNAGYAFMWHSHTEKELTNWGIFPGGLMTMLIIQPPGVPITE